MKTYKILSVIFIVVCLGFAVAAIALPNVPTIMKIVLVFCMLVICVAMGYNIRMINRRQKNNKQ